MSPTEALGIRPSEPDTAAHSSVVFFLRLRLVPMIDASGAAAFTGFLDRAHKLGIRVVLSGLQPQPRAPLTRMHALAHPVIAVDVSGFEQVVPAARVLVGSA